MGRKPTEERIHGGLRTWAFWGSGARAAAGGIARVAAGVFAMCLWASCGRAPEARPPAGPEAYFTVAVGGAPARVQLALDEAERSRGLMHREGLPEDHGMLFVFDRPSPQAFWMRNTSIPLDIGYFDGAGRLLEIRELYPFDETPVPSRSAAVRYALEMNRGWFDRRGVAPGARLDLDTVAAAIDGRGGDPGAHRPPEPGREH